jgi:hypothetical protein
MNLNTIKNLSPKLAAQYVSHFIGRTHLTIFIILVVAGLAAAVLTMTTILNESSSVSSPGTSGDVSTGDQATINRLNQLHTSAEGTPELSQPGGRANPFGE